MDQQNRPKFFLGISRATFILFLQKSLAISNYSTTFATPEPAKPLNDAQMCGSFYFYNINAMGFPRGWENELLWNTPIA
ncbi:MAG: hypothetical protein IJV44_09880 [Prevotella sp.]|nr:hypothetical protein [Prevotella sp.]